MAAVAESFCGESGVCRDEGLGVGNCGDIRTDLVMLLRVAGHQVGGQDVAWTATLESASTARTPRVAALLLSVVYSSKTESA
jgi:hypothetical protein